MLGDFCSRHEIISLLRRENDTSSGILVLKSHLNELTNVASLDKYTNICLCINNENNLITKTTKTKQNTYRNTNKNIVNVVNHIKVYENYVVVTIITNNNRP